MSFIKAFKSLIKGLTRDLFQDLFDLKKFLELDLENKRSIGALEIYSLYKKQFYSKTKVIFLNELINLLNIEN